MFEMGFIDNEEFERAKIPHSHSPTRILLYKSAPFCNDGPRIFS